MLQLRSCIVAVLALVTGASAALAQDFALPRPPQELVTPAKRASYLVEHYWDNADLSTIIPDDVPSEQAFVNYIALFPLTESDSLCRESVRCLMMRADSIGVSQNFATIADKYLYSMDSPMLDEECFMYFADAALFCRKLDSIYKRGLPYKRQVFMNNRLGSEMADFSFEDVSGRLMDLSEIRGKRLVLIFDPECEDCKTLIKRLETQAPQDCTVVAVAVNTTRSAFRSFAAGLPQDWIRAWDSTGYVNGGAIALRKLPDTFLISEDGTVLKKHFQILF